MLLYRVLYRSRPLEYLSTDYNFFYEKTPKRCMKRQLNDTLGLLLCHISNPHQALIRYLDLLMLSWLADHNRLLRGWGWCEFLHCLKEADLMPIDSSRIRSLPCDCILMPFSSFAEWALALQQLQGYATFRIKIQDSCVPQVFRKHKSQLLSSPIILILS